MNDVIATSQYTLLKRFNYKTRNKGKTRKRRAFRSPFHFLDKQKHLRKILTIFYYKMCPIIDKQLFDLKFSLQLHSKAQRHMKHIERGDLYISNTL